MDFIRLFTLLCTLTTGTSGTFLHRALGLPFDCRYRESIRPCMLAFSCWLQGGRHGGGCGGNNWLFACCIFDNVSAARPNEKSVAAPIRRNSPPPPHPNAIRRRMDNNLLQVSGCRNELLGWLSCCQDVARITEDQSNQSKQLFTISGQLWYPSQWKQYYSEANHRRTSSWVCRICMASSHPHFRISMWWCPDRAQLCSHRRSLHQVRSIKGHHRLSGRIGHSKLGKCDRAVAGGEALCRTEDRPSQVSFPHDSARSIWCCSAALGSTSRLSVTYFSHLSSQWANTVGGYDGSDCWLGKDWCNFRADRDKYIANGDGTNHKSSQVCGVAWKETNWYWFVSGNAVCWTRGRASGCLPGRLGLVERFFFAFAWLTDLKYFIGGPLIVLNKGKYYLVGITSAGFGCGVDNQPGIYLNVQKVLSWLQNVVKGGYVF